MFSKTIKTPMRRQLRGSKARQSLLGFSLIEVAMVMVILALLSAAGVTYGPTYVANNRIRSATETFRAGLGIARSEATKQNRPINFVINPGGAEWRVETVATPTTPTVVVIRTGSLTDHGGVTGAFSTAATVTFDSFGRGTGAGPNFDFASNAGTCETTGGGGGQLRCLRVVLGAGGQATVCDPVMSYALNSAGCKP